MKCTNCKHKFTKSELTALQEDKDDYWLCTCGDFHKGFPFECRLTTIQKRIIRDYEDCSSFRDFKETIIWRAKHKEWY